MRTRALLLAGLLLLGGCVSGASSPFAERAVHRAVIEEERASIGGAAEWIVISHGEFRSRSADLGEALKLSDKAGEDPAAHRYVFRPGDETPRDLRLAFLHQGGRAAGRGLAEALGIEIEKGATNAVTLIKAGKRVRLPVDDARMLRIEVAVPDGSAGFRMDVPFDPDFDGGLLLDPATASDLRLALFEKPGDGVLRVALGRPFGVLRATVRVRVPALEAEGLVEAVHADLGPRR